MNLIGLLFSSVFTIINIVLLAGLILLLILAIRALSKYVHSKRPEPTISEGRQATEENKAVKQPLNEVLKELRQKNNMTQEFVAEQLNISRQAVSKWESGTSSPTMANLAALTALYHISMDELLRRIQ